MIPKTIEGLSLEEQATNYQTLLHIQTVQHFMNLVIRQLLDRAEAHDQSKLDRPEVQAFSEYTPKLAASTYGSPEYEGFRKAMGPALAHHYAKNSHHPEHFDAGVSDMTLLDLIEMFCDWKAATLRHHDGNLRKSIKINAERFGINPQLVRILENTAAMFD